MARVLLLGGTRFVGRALTTHAMSLGHEVAVFHRGRTGNDLQVTHLHGDREQLQEHADALLAFRPEVVIDCTAYTEDEAQRAAEVFDGLDVRMLVLSSMDVYEVFRRVLQGHAFGDVPVIESDPLSAERYYHGHHRIKDYDKNLMTDAVLRAAERGVYRPTVFRLPMVFGPGDPQIAHRHGEAIHHVLDRRERYVIGAVAQCEYWTFGYVDNVAAAVLHALDHPQTIGRIYNVGERRVRTRRQWIEAYAAAADHAFAFAPVPDAWLEDDDDPEPVGLDMAPRHLLLSSEAYAADTGFVAPVSTDEQIASTLAWAFDHPEDLGPAPDYAAREVLFDQLAAMTPSG